MLSFKPAFFSQSFLSFTVKFEESGTFDYFCTLHPWMKGKVIVE